MTTQTRTPSIILPTNPEELQKLLDALLSDDDDEVQRVWDEHHAISPGPDLVIGTLVDEANGVSGTNAVSHHRVEGCCSKHIGSCRGTTADLWQCLGCGQISCPAEGADDAHFDYCDVCADELILSGK